MIKRFAIVIFGAALIVGLLAWIFSRAETESIAYLSLPQDADASMRGAAIFEAAAFGGVSLDAMESHALPWRLVAGALVLDAKKQSPGMPVTQKSVDEILGKFGFLSNVTVLNSAYKNAVSSFPMPLGMTFGDLAPIGGAKIRVSNLGCSACHAGVTYDRLGNPRPDAVWLGMPNTSLNLEAYTSAVFEALREGIKQPDKLLAIVNQLFPGMDFRERQSLRFIIIPIVKKRMEALSDFDRALPFPNGVPGSTNGVAALKHKFGVPLYQNGPGDAGIVSIPDLSNRYFRASLLADGAYGVLNTDNNVATKRKDIDDAHLTALATIITFFTVPSMGVSPDEAITHLDEVKDILAFLQQTYRPQKFPGEINMEFASQGREIYTRECSSCHGTYSKKDGVQELNIYPNWLGNVGTDTLRAEVFSPELVSAFANTAYNSKFTVSKTGKYNAPPLSGIWASAPYLHNGSVPTLRSILSPEARVSYFQLGGHALDFEQVGIRIKADGAYPEGYKSFSNPVWFDTSKPGHGNKGHTFGATLSKLEKDQLIEYLKLL